MECGGRLDRRVGKRPELSRYRSIGVIGGMGPASTLRFLESVVERYRVRLQAIRNCDFPLITLQTIPGADHMGDAPNVDLVSRLRAALRLLTVAKSNFIVAPCNTVHQFFPVLAKSSPTPLLNIVNVVSKLKAPVSKGARVLLLGTRQTRIARLYADAFLRKEWKCVFPRESDQTALDNIILRANAGRVPTNLSKRLSKLINSYDTEGVLLACTELSLVPIDVRQCVIDSLEELADATYLISSKQRDIAYYSADS